MIAFLKPREAPMSHVPVMAGEVMDLIGASPGQLLVDLTVGAGGHAQAFLDATGPTGRVIGCDRDPEALALAELRLASFGSRVEFLHGDSSRCLDELAQRGVRPDAILLDLGVSSMQLDEVERGFSLREDGPLDMRMDPGEPITAADLVNESSSDELVRVLRELGEEPRADRLARAIVERRRRRPFRTTGDLRELVELTLRRSGGRIHPATRLFQALRMEVNRELPLLEQSLPRALERLVPGGHLAVLAFHSGEDRVVKRVFRAEAEAGRAELITPKPRTPGRDELRVNRRSRSARLRVLRRVLPGETESAA